MEQILLDLCELRKFRKGDVILHQKDKPDGMYIIKSGTVEVERDGAIISTMKECDFFGAMGLLLHEKRSATIRVTSEELTAHFLSKIAFEEVKDELGEEVIEKALQRYGQTYKNKFG